MKVETKGRHRSHPGFGAFVVSLDFELHWGIRGGAGNDTRYRRNLLGERQVLPRILHLFGQYGIAATWATVGFLFASGAEELRRFSPDGRPSYADRSLDPYQERVGQSEVDDPLHFAPSLIAAIRRTPRQEIGTHTFSHYYCLAPLQTKEEFRADLASAIAIAQHYGLSLRSAVFPRNQVNDRYMDVLGEAGIICYRGVQKGWMNRATSEESAPRRVLRLADSYVTVNEGWSNLTPWDEILRPDGLCNVPASRFLRPYNPVLRALEGKRLSRIVKCLREAAREHKIFHLWWHPHNFGVYQEENLAFLSAVLDEVDRLRRSAGLQSLNLLQAACVARGDDAASAF